MGKLIPVNSRAITSPPEMGLLLDVECKRAVIIKPRFILLHTWITLVGTKHSTRQMHIQTLNWIISTPDTSPRKHTNCIADCRPINSVFQMHPPVNTQVRNSLCHRNGYREWWMIRTSLWCYNSHSAIGQEHQSSGGKEFLHMHELVQSPVDHNLTQWQNRGPQHHDGSW